MFKTILTVAATACVASAQMANLMDLFILDELSHTGDYYYYGGGFHDLLPLLALGGMGGGFPTQGDSVMFEEYLLWQDLMHGTHSHGRHGMDEILPLMLIGMNEGMSTFDSMMMIHEHDIAQSYDERFLGGDGLLTAMAAMDPALNGNLHDFHVIEGVLSQQHNTNGANLLPLAFLTSDDPAVQMENMHQYHYLQNWGNGHNDFLPLAVLGGNMFNTVEPIVPYWAMDQIINGDDYYYDEHSHHAHGGPNDDSLFPLFALGAVGGNNFLDATNPIPQMVLLADHLAEGSHHSGYSHHGHGYSHAPRVVHRPHYGGRVHHAHHY